MKKPSEIVEWTYEDFVGQEFTGFSKSARGIILHYTTENKKLKEECNNFKKNNEKLNEEIIITQRGHPKT